jgi:predicted  nucleic acid-binding Zn-ribbon protein
MIGSDGAMVYHKRKWRIMKHRMMTLAVTGLMVGLLSTGCEKTAEQQVQSNNEKVGDAKQELKDAQTDLKVEWQKFKTASEEQITKNENRITAFKEKMEASGAKSKTKYNKEIAKLEQKNRELKQKLDDYKDEGQGKWETFKANFTRDMDDLGKTMKDLFKDNG